MRLIDADAVIPKGTKVTDDVIAVHTALMNAPTIDAVPVVRCKDCKWGIDSAANPLIKWCNQHATHFKNNDYCSYGERKDGEG